VFAYSTIPFEYAKSEDRAKVEREKDDGNHLKLHPLYIDSNIPSK